LLEARDGRVERGEDTEGGGSRQLAYHRQDGIQPMNRQEIVQRRLANHHLSGAPLATPEAAVGWLTAVQAQDYPGASWSIGIRTRASSDALDLALAEGTILRTHILRPTWHFVLPSDIRWLQRLTAARVHRQVASYRRRMGLDEAVFARSNALLATALAGRRLTRVEIAALLRDRAIPVDDSRFGHLLMHAELDLLICSAGLKGRQQTFGLLDERVPPAAPIPREEALARLAMRYFASHGPATDRDLAWWSGLTLTDVRLGVDLAGPDIESTTLGDRTYRFVPSRAAPSNDPVGAHLLQGFDEYVIAYSQSRDLLDLAGIAATVASETLRIHVVLVEGQVVARWRRVAEKEAVLVDMRLERPLEEDEMRAVEDAVERYAGFLKTPTRLVVSR
jgi:hypothetical protein